MIGADKVASCNSAAGSQASEGLAKKLGLKPFAEVVACY